MCLLQAALAESFGHCAAATLDICRRLGLLQLERAPVWKAKGSWRATAEHFGLVERHGDEPLGLGSAYLKYAPLSARLVERAIAGRWEDVPKLLHGPTCVPPVRSTKLRAQEGSTALERVPKSKWVPDDASDSCMACGNIFSTARCWRHHCRFCGKLLCKQCLPYSMVPRGETAAVECCEKCRRVANHGTINWIREKQEQLWAGEAMAADALHTEIASIEAELQRQQDGGAAAEDVGAARVVLEQIKDVQMGLCGVTLVVFVGGCTRGEIAALGLVGKRLKRRILIATTAQISGITLIDAARVRWEDDHVGAGNVFL